MDVKLFDISETKKQSDEVNNPQQQSQQNKFETTVADSSGNVNPLEDVPVLNQIKLSEMKYPSNLVTKETEENLSRTVIDLSHNTKQTIIDEVESVKTETNTAVLEPTAGTSAVEQPQKSIIKDVLDKIKTRNNFDGENGRETNSFSFVENLMDDKPVFTLINENAKDSIDKGTQDTLIKKVDKLAISDMPLPLSEVILKNPSESLRHLLVYEGTTDEEDEYDDFEKNWQLYALQDQNQSSSDSESDSNESLENGDTDDTEEGTSIEIVDLTAKGNDKKNTEDDVPKNDYIEDFQEPSVDLSSLSIDYDREEFLHIGQVKAIIDTIVTVEAFPGTAAYDLDSVLFVENQNAKRPLGTIFDVIGPVTSPIYCIRFKNREDIDQIALKIGDKVYSAPQSEYTRYVFMKELLRLRGTDASWVGDKELPEELIDISDEEKESILEEIRQSSKKRKFGSLERHQRFEKNMNKYNAMNSKVYQIVDTHDRLERSLQNMQTIASPRLQGSQNFSPSLIPQFDPTIPPPGFRDSPPATLMNNTNTASGSRLFKDACGGPEPSSTYTFPPTMEFLPANQSLNTLPGQRLNPSQNVVSQGQSISGQYRHNPAGRSNNRRHKRLLYPPEWNY